MKIKTKLLLITMLIASIMSLIGIISYYSINNVKINGDLYSRIIDGKDLIADILPPPKFIVESYLVSFQLCFEKNKTKFDELLAQKDRLQKEYFERHKYWDDKLVSDNIKNFLEKESFAPAREFFDIQNGEFFAELKKGEQIGALNILETKMKPLYLKHKEAIEKTVELANAKNKEIENTAEAKVSNMIYLIIISVFISVISILTSMFFLTKSITNPIMKLVAVVQKMSRGDFGDFSKVKY